LGALVDEVTTALAPYSRWLARTPGGRGSVASTVLLPSDLLDHEPGPLLPLMTWADDRLGGSLHAVVDGTQFAPFWSSADPRGMSREEAASLALVLARIGLGVEPDVRFAGPPLGPGPVVLFRLDPQATDRPGAGHRAACTLVSLAATILLAIGDPNDASAADGTVNRTVTALAAQVHLTVEERSRLGARLRWLLAGGADPTRLRRRAEALTPAERDAAGHFLIRVAAESSPIGPAVLDALAAGYRLLELPADQLYRGLHAALAAEQDAAAQTSDHTVGRGPVVARRGRPVPGGHTLPWAEPRPVLPGSVAGPATGQTPDEAGSEAVGETSGSRVLLRQAVIRRRILETDAVATLLAGIFTADADAPHGATGHGATGHGATGHSATGHSATGRTGLDAVHRTILTEVAARPRWSSTEFAALTGRHGVLPAGALDVINDAAIEITGAPAIGGDDVLRADDDVVRELLE
jgi:TerB-C domain